MAISDTITINASEAISQLDAFAEAAVRAEEAFAKIGKGGGRGLGLDGLAGSMDAAAARIDAAVKKIAGSMARLDAIGASGKSAAAGLDSLAGSAAGAEGKLKAVGDAGKAAGDGLKTVGDAGKAAGDGLKATGDGAKASEAFLAEFNATLAETAAMQREVAAVSADASAKIAAGQRLNTAAARQAATDAAAARRVQAAEAKQAAAVTESGFGKFLKTTLIGGGIAAAWGIDKAMKLQAEVTRLFTAAGLHGVSQAQATQAALSIGTKTGFSAQAIAEAMYHPVSAGLDWKSTQALTTQAANLANVHGASLEDTAYSLSSVMKAYNLGARQVTPTASLLNSIVGQGDMRFQDFNQSIKSWAPTGAAMGISIQSMGSALAYLTDRGNSAEEAATKLTMGLSMATSGSKQANTYLHQLGLTTGSVTLRNESLAQVMNKAGLTTNRLAADLRKPDGIYFALSDLQHAFHKAGLSSEQANQVMGKLFGGGRSDKGILSLMQNLEGLRQKYDQITQGTKDYGKDVSKEQQTAAQHWKNFTAGLSNLGTGFGVTLLPAFTKLTGEASKFISWLGQGQGKIKAMAIGFGGLAALFTGKKLVSGIESAFKTAETGLRFTGKVAQVLHIPGLDKLANIGQAGGIEAAMVSGGRAAGAEIQAAMVAGGRAVAAEMDVGKPGVLVPGGGRGGALAAEEEAAAGLGLGSLFKNGALGLGRGAGQLAFGYLLYETIVAPLLRQYGGKPGQQIARNTSPTGIWHDIFGTPGTPPRRVTVAPPGMPGFQPPGQYTQAPVGGTPGHPGLWHWSMHAFDDMVTQQSRDNIIRSVGHALNTAVDHAVASPFDTVRHGVATAFSAPFHALFGGGGPKPKGFSLGQGDLSGLHAPKPVKIPAPDTSAVTAAKAKVTAALNVISGIKVKPAKVPPPDLGPLDAAKAKAANAGAQIFRGVETPLKKPAKMAPPDLSAAQGDVGKAKAIGASISAGLAAGIQAGIPAIAAAASAAAAAAAPAMAAAAKVRSPSEVTFRIGKDVGAGFEHGIRSKIHAVKKAAHELSAAAASSLQQGLLGGKSAVDAVMTALGKGPRPQDITTIDQTAKKLISEVPKGHSELVRMLKADESELDRLARRRAVLMTEIQDADQVTRSMISGASIMNATSAQPWTAQDRLSPYAVTQGMAYQAGNLKEFASQVSTLKKMGLNATSLDQIIQAGPDQGLQIAQALTSGGAASVKQVNQLEASILKSSGKIGDVGGGAMYQAGVDAGNAAAKGLRSQLGEVEAVMKKIAASMVKALQSVLGHSTAPAKKTSSSSFAASGGGGGSGAASSAAGGTALRIPDLGRLAQMAEAAASALARDAAAGNSAASALNRLATAASHAHGGGGGHGRGGHGGGSLNITIPVTVTIDGREVTHTVQHHVLEMSANNWTTGWRYPGRAI